MYKLNMLMFKLLGKGQWETINRTDGTFATECSVIQ